MATVSVRAHARRREAAVRPTEPQTRLEYDARKDGIRAVRSVDARDKWSYYVETSDPDAGIANNKLMIRKLKSGAVTISDETSPGAESFIYLYPDQVAALKKLLAKK